MFRVSVILLYIFYFLLSFKHKILLLLGCIAFLATKAQVVAVRGVVYDTTGITPVKNVWVTSLCGGSSLTDSLGRYEVTASVSDSLVFTYRQKSTLKFAIKEISDINDFNISLHVRVAERFKTLKEVRVFSKTYRQDSIENRMAYAKIFNYEKPGISTSSSSYSGVPGLDLDEFINIFRFRRNKQLARMQQRLEDEEKEKFVNYRFNKITVKRITGLSGKDIEDFMTIYRPTYVFTLQSSTVDFYQYILNCSYEYKRLKLKLQLSPKNP